MELSHEDAVAIGLIKGVALTEGELKSGEAMTRDNVIMGAGAMRASALNGTARLDIDHHYDKLPPEYLEKYGGEIANPYPPGFIIDAQAVENEIPGSGETRMQVEFLAIIENRTVYDMIKAGKIKGCSVVDFIRNVNCDGEKSVDGGGPGCQYEGSAYLENTLILDEVPNSNSTWVAVVSDADIGTIIANRSEEVKNKLRKQMRHSLSPVQKIIINAHAGSNWSDEQSLDAYMTDGIWNNGAESIADYLKSEKSIDEAVAAKMADYLIKNPETLSQYQLEWLSMEDLSAWWTSIQTSGAPNAEIHALKAEIAKLKWLPTNKSELARISGVQKGHALTRDDVKYHRAAKSNACNGCRFAGFYDDKTGYCNLINGAVDADGTCDKFTAPDGAPPAADAPTDKSADPPATDKPADADPSDKPADAPADKDCTCADKHNEPVPPNEDGSCPDGYTISEDGTECIPDNATGDDPASGDGGSGQPGPVPSSVKHGKPAPSKKPTTQAAIEADPVKNQKAQATEIDKQIAELVKKYKALPPTLYGREGMAAIAERQRIKDEIIRLTALKKS